VPDITIPPDTLRKATLHGVDEALACVKRVGYPCMIKASEGGGGKGIRKVMNDEELRVGYEQVEAEVPITLQEILVAQVEVLDIMDHFKVEVVVTHHQ
jgi:biotin carboxylase